MIPPRKFVLWALLCGVLLAGGALALAAPGDLSLVSVSSTGAQGGSSAEAAAVSADGRHVAFTSAATLTTAPTGGKVQLYVRDRATGTTALASASAAGAASDADVDAQDDGDVQFSISRDGRYVVFASRATNLAGADADATQDVYRKDMTTGAVVLVSVDSAGAKANAAVVGDPDVSADGNRISFGSGAATNLAGTDANAASSDVVVRDIAAGTTVLAAQSTVGAQANGVTERSAISADGHVVSFEARAGTTNLVPNDTGGGSDVVVRNLVSGATSPASDPASPDGASFSDVSGDGRYVVFQTDHAYDAAHDVSAGSDVYRRDMGTGAIALVSARTAADVGGAGDALRPAISANGDRVSFSSTSPDLTADANAAIGDVFVRDITARTTRLASVRADGTTQGSNAAERAAMAANGGLVAFASDDSAAVTKLVPGDANAQPDIHAKELAPSDSMPPVLILNGPVDGAAPETADRVAVSGTASDVSGIVAVTVGGMPVALTAAGGFSVAVAVGVGTNPIVVTALDGAGNLQMLTRTITRVVPVIPIRAPGPAARLRKVSAQVVRGGVLVRIRLSASARVRVGLVRRTVGRRFGRVALKTGGKTVTRTLVAGRRSITLRPRSLRAGRYLVRVRILRVGAPTRSIALRVTRGRATIFSGSS